MKTLMTYRHFIALILFSLVILFCSQPSNFFYTKVKIDTIVKNDIIAPKSVTYIDEKATQDLKDEALKETKSVYDRNASVSEKQLAELNTFLNHLLVEKLR
ncbi:hypothetical protein F6Y05_36570 [Bacillus megaterium]|nr:hypothetical protein [Priestia megaterium]